MAAGIQPSGFQVSVMPQFQGADPRLFNPYGAFGSGLSSGLESGARLADISFRREQMAREAERDAYDASLRPLRRALLDAQISDAANKAAAGDIVWGSVTRENVNPSVSLPAQAPHGGFVVDEGLTGGSFNEFTGARDASGSQIMVSTGKPTYGPGDEVEVQVGQRFVGGRPVGQVEKRKLLKTEVERIDEMEKSRLESEKRLADIADIKSRAPARTAKAAADSRRLDLAGKSANPKIKQLVDLLNEARAEEASDETLDFYRRSIDKELALADRRTTGQNKIDELGVRAGLSASVRDELAKTTAGMTIMNKLAARQSLISRGELDLEALIKEGDTTILLTPEETEMLSKVRSSVESGVPPVGGPIGPAGVQDPTGVLRPTAPRQPAPAAPPQSAVNYLRQNVQSNPQLREQFAAKYGEEALRAALAGF